MAGYDTAYTVAWGRDLAQGLGLDLTHALRPTPHPLPILWSFITSALTTNTSLYLVGALTATAWAWVVAEVTHLTWLGSRDPRLSAAAGLTVASGAGLMLVTLDAHPDVWFLALCLCALRLIGCRRFAPAVALLWVAALVRPEAAGFALATCLWWLLASPSSPRPRRPMRTSADGATTADVFGRFKLLKPCSWAMGGLAACAVAWLGLGAIGGQPWVALTSAAGNATATGEPVGLDAVVPLIGAGLSAGYGPLVTWTTGALALTALIVRLVRRWHQRGHDSTGVPSSAGLPAATAYSPAIESPTKTAPTTATSSRVRRAIVGLFFMDMAAFVFQGWAGTPLIPRYLLLASILQIPLLLLTAQHLMRSAPLHLPVSSWLRRSALLTATPRAGGALTLLAGTAMAAGCLALAVLPNLGRWAELRETMHVRETVLSQAEEVLLSLNREGGATPIDTEAAPSPDTGCGAAAQLSVRSPTMVPFVAIWRQEPLDAVQMAASDGAFTGQLLQPRTVAAATVAGSGPYTPLAEQVSVAGTPRLLGQTAQWALLTLCP